MEGERVYVITQFCADYEDPVFVVFSSRAKAIQFVQSAYAQGETGMDIACIPLDPDSDQWPEVITKGHERLPGAF